MLSRAAEAMIPTAAAKMPPQASGFEQSNIRAPRTGYSDRPVPNRSFEDVGGDAQA